MQWSWTFIDGVCHKVAQILMLLVASNVATIMGQKWLHFQLSQMGHFERYTVMLTCRLGLAEK